MKVTFTIASEKVRQMLADNSIHLGTHISYRLRERKVPVRPGILPVINPELASGAITIDLKSDDSITVLAEWTDKDDDDL